MNTVSPPIPAADELDAHRLVLRDGSVAVLRPAAPSDTQAMRRFFHELSPEARRHRFFISGEAPDTLIDRFCAAADPAQSVTLIACRRAGNAGRIIAVASYFRITDAVDHAAPADPTDGVLIQPMVADALETIVGVTTDPLFGPLVGFGPGGTQVELLGDMRFRIAPLTDHDADELLREGRGFRLLQGYRGHPAVDVAALREVVLRVSRLAEAVPEIAELDLNPVMALAAGKGCGIVDARIKVARSSHPPSTSVSQKPQQ